jgi:predicted nucleic acid-binding protein
MPPHAGHRQVLLHMKRSHPLVLKRVQSVRVDDVCMSVVTRAELLYGVEVSPRARSGYRPLPAFPPSVEAVGLGRGFTTPTSVLT